MKIFMKWRPRKPRETVEKAASAEGETASSGMQHSAGLLPRLHRQLRGETCSGTQTVNVNQQADPLPDDRSFNGSHDMKCPIYSSALLHCNEPIESSDVNTKTDLGTEHYDMNLLIYQYTIQNALFSIGTLGGELLRGIASDESLEECSTFLKEGIGDSVPNTSTARDTKHCASLDAVHLNEFSLKGSISGITSTDDKVQVQELLRTCTHNDKQKFDKEEVGVLEGIKVATAPSHTADAVQNFNVPMPSVSCTHEAAQVEMAWPCREDITEKFKCASSTSWATSFNHGATPQEELTNQEAIFMHQPINAYMSASCGKPVGVSEDGNSKSQQFLTLLSKDLDVISAEEENGYNPMKNNMAFYIKNGMNSLKDSTLDDFLKSLYIFGELTQQNPGGVEDALSIKCRSAQELMMGPSKSVKDALQGSGSSESAQGGRNEEDEELEDKYECMAAQQDCLQLAYACNMQHSMGLKRLIKYVAKHLLKRLKLGHRQTKMDGRPLHVNCDQLHQCKFYKLLRMLGMSSRTRGGSVIGRELGPLGAVGHHDHLNEQISASKLKEGNEEEICSCSCTFHTDTEAESCFSTHRCSSSTSMTLLSNAENWIKTDDEYVVLELEGNKQ